MSPAEGIYGILNAHNFFTGGWTPFVGYFGAADNSLLMVNSGGRNPEVLVGIDYPNVQIIGRGNKATNSYSILYDKMKAAKLLLHAIMETPQKATAFPELVSCLVRGDITQMGLDDNKRPLMSLNFQLITAPIDTGNRELHP